jgi:hypothetical protein
MRSKIIQEILDTTPKDVANVVIGEEVNSTKSFQKT